uniref:Uncharacterized protein n=1 Tax=Anguilla anguilla TaxID=7936 RepID=A0A0E9XC91_ANGAN
MYLKGGVLLTLLAAFQVIFVFLQCLVALGCVLVLVFGDDTAENLSGLMPRRSVSLPFGYPQLRDHYIPSVLSVSRSVLKFISD